MTSFSANKLPLLDEKRGVQKKFEYVTKDRVMLVYVAARRDRPDFYDRLKSRLLAVMHRSIITCPAIR